MSKNNGKTWKTKFGPRRVRREEPDLQEAIAAAQGLTDDPVEQAEFAASLIGLPVEQVRAVMLKMPPPRRETPTTITFSGRPSAPRMVVVERKPSRRVLAMPARSEALISRR